MSGFYQEGDNPEVTLEAQQWADLARDWAIKLGDTVDGVDFSSKHYAQQSQTEADRAKDEADRAEEAAAGIDPKALDDLTDVITAGAADTDVLTFQASDQTWRPVPVPGLGVQYVPLDGSDHMTGSLKVDGFGWDIFEADGTTQRQLAFLSPTETGISLLDALGNNGADAEVLDIRHTIDTPGTTLKSTVQLRESNDASYSGWNFDGRFLVRPNTAGTKGEMGFGFLDDAATLHAWFGTNTPFGGGNLEDLNLVINRVNNTSTVDFIVMRNETDGNIFQVRSDGSVDIPAGAEFRIDGVPIGGGGSGGQVDSVVGGAGISVDDTDPVNPIVLVNEPYLNGLYLSLAGGTVSGIIQDTTPSDGADPASRLVRKDYVDLAITTVVPVTRNINTVNGLTGGGALSGDLTLDVQLRPDPGLQKNSSGIRVGAGNGILRSGDLISVDPFVVVGTTGNQSVDGIKTFTTLPQTALTPTLDDHLVNKAYVDAAVGGGLTGGDGISVSGSTISVDLDAGGGLLFNAGELAADPFVLVNISGNQTISGQKTFSTLPLVTVDANTSNGLMRRSYADNRYARPGSSETISGLWRYSNDPEIINPQSAGDPDDQIMRKDYIDLGDALSDERLKENVTSLDEDWCVNMLYATDPTANFKWKDDSVGEGRQAIGWLAQTLHSMAPDATRPCGEWLGVDLKAITAILWQQNRALLRRIEALGG